MDTRLLKRLARPFAIIVLLGCAGVALCPSTFSVPVLRVGTRLSPRAVGYSRTPPPWDAALFPSWSLTNPPPTLLDDPLLMWQAPKGGEFAAASKGASIKERPFAERPPLTPRERRHVGVAAAETRARKTLTSWWSAHPEAPRGISCLKSARDPATLANWINHGSPLFPPRILPSLPPRASLSPLAYVVPFVSSQLSNVLFLLSKWTLTPPCNFTPLQHQPHSK
jgi:hypothetical protein